MNESVSKTINFISEWKSPYLASQHIEQHHQTTGKCVHEMDSKKLLEYFKHGEKSYIEFRNETFLGETKALFDVNKKVLLKIKIINKI